MIVERDVYQLGSLSHYINAPSTGYNPLPPFPDVAPDPSVRSVEPPPATWQVNNEKKKTPMKKKSFYSETETSSTEGNRSFFLHIYLTLLKITVKATSRW